MPKLPGCPTAQHGRGRARPGGSEFPPLQIWTLPGSQQSQGYEVSCQAGAQREQVSGGRTGPHSTDPREQLDICLVALEGSSLCIFRKSEGTAVTQQLPRCLGNALGSGKGLPAWVQAGG